MDVEPIQTDPLKRQFASLFNGEPTGFVRAPGRVNLIGEHTDYNDGFVCPMAIEPEVVVAFRPRQDGRVQLASTYAPSQLVEFSLNASIERAKPKWGNYPRGVAAGLLARGLPLVGMDALYTNNLPVGGGLSSSAAIEVATGVCLLSLAGQTLDPLELAKLCQKAEHDYAGMPCGIMDQMIVAGARAGHATLFDCRSSAERFVPVDPQDVRVVICNSMVKHELTGGEYAERRAQCEAGVAFFQKADAGVRALRDVTVESLEAAEASLDDLTFRRCRHVVTENARCVAAGEALVHRNYGVVGQRMVQSHESLRDDFEVSVPEIDFLVDQAMRVDGVFGARITGGGFGGCVVALVKPDAVEPLQQHLRQTYRARYDLDPTVFATTATAGASVTD